MTDDLDVRASDEERERVATEIREHFAQGRLDGDELADRLQRAYAARTRRELEELRHDLPRLPAPPSARRAEVATRRSELTRELVQQTGASFGPFVVCTLIWLASGADGSFWPAWLLLMPLIPLLRNLWRLYGPVPELDRVERELRQGRHHGRHHRS
ncbi:MAG TPA: DUF1707 domain-containing protein [Gaiellaceae bacterium]|nr:DUF1707 domain-containing protein [Gaiellaceae bacterium]